MREKQLLVHKFGVNTDIDVFTGADEDIVSQGGLQYWAAAAAKIDVTSSDAADTLAGTGARTVRIQGLDANYLEISEDVRLNGVTIVETEQLFLRVNRAHVISAGSGGVNAGVITMNDGTGDQAIISIGDSQTLKTSYTVPAGVKDAIMMSVHFDLNEKIAHFALARILTREVGEVWRVRLTLSATSGSGFNIIGNLVGLAAKSDLRLTAVDADADSLSVAAGYEIQY